MAGSFRLWISGLTRRYPDRARPYLHPRRPPRYRGQISATAPHSDPEALAALWDLSPLVDGDEVSGTDTLLCAAEEAAQMFADELRGQVADLDAAGLIAAMHKLAEIRDLIHRAGAFANLRFAADTGTAEHGALVQSVKERTTALETQLRFFELEWVAVEDSLAEALLQQGGDALEFAAHHLRTMRSKRPYLLPAAEERILAESQMSGREAWTRWFEERFSSDITELDGETVPLQAAYMQWFDPDRDKRIKAVDAMVAALGPLGRERAYIYNTLIHDRAIEDRLRGYPSWISARNLENQISDAAVAALVEAVQARYDISRRWFRVKARLLGLERVTTCDMLSPVYAPTTPIPYGDARELVLSAYREFSPEVGAITRRFFDENWIDAPLRPNKMGGAFMETGGANRHPYVLLNYSGRRWDVLTMAHELGHGLHDVLAAPRGTFHLQTPLTLAETASTFGESLLIDRMLEQATSDRERVSLLADGIGSSILSIFWQVAFNRFEDRVHTHRREHGELTAEQIDAAYDETTRDAWVGDAVEHVPGMERFWAILPHFFLWPGYVYAYAFGMLLSLSVFARYKEIGPSFVPRYLEMLASGGSRSPEDTVAIVGLDLRDPAFWATGLELVDEQLRAVEELAAKLTPDRPPNPHG